MCENVLDNNGMNSICATPEEHIHMHSIKCANCTCLSCTRRGNCRCQLCDNSVQARFVCKEKVY